MTLYTVNIIDLINFAIAISGLTISLSGLALALHAKAARRCSRTFFLCVFIILIIYTSSDLLAQISLTFLGRGYSFLSGLSIFFESFFSSTLMPLLTVYILHLCKESPRGRLFSRTPAQGNIPAEQSAGGVRAGRVFVSPYFIITTVLWIVYAALLVITQFTTLIYYINDDNVYMRGPYYPILLIPALLLMLFNMIGLYRRRKKLTSKEQHAFWAYLIIPAIATLVQMVSYGLHMIVLGTTVSAIVMFVYILDDQSGKADDAATELKEQSLRIRTLQMRPHFLYNTMSNIYYLCELDPKKAQKVVGDFTVYLRNNFSAVATNKLIPFEKELEHATAFLDVVKARYEDFLFVEYDIPYTSFLIPPLTLEPIVENAVKHGLDPELPPLHVWIRTRQTESGVEIIVENSGADLTPEDMILINGDSVNDEPHIGLDNVSDRLKALCGGTVEIRPREKNDADLKKSGTADKEGGVTVILRIPSRS